MITDILSTTWIIMYWNKHTNTTINTPSVPVQTFNNKLKANPLEGLVLVITKCTAHGGVPLAFWHSYMILFCNQLSTMVRPYGVIKKVFLYSTIQHNTLALRAKYVPNAGVLGEMGWQLPACRMWIAVTR